MADNEHNSSADDRNTIYLFGGLALMVLGAGLIVANPTIRKTVTAGLAGILPEMRGKLIPDLGVVGSYMQRYLTMWSM